LRRKRGRDDFPTLETFFLSSTLRKKKKTMKIKKTKKNEKTFNAYRVQHDDSRGPFKGGLRYHPQVRER